MEERKNIAKAIIKVMKAVKGMEKNSKVGSGSYAYSGTKDQDVKEVFNDALANNGLCIMPIDIEESAQVDRWEEEYNGNKKQKQSIFTKVKVKYLLLHDSGESIELCGYGHGVDNQDKGAGKATTYALKNCLLYTFLTPVGKIDDTDTTHSEEIATPRETFKTQTPVVKKATIKKPFTKLIELKTGTPDFEKVKKFLIGGGDYAELSIKYTISEEVKTKLYEY